MSEPKQVEGMSLATIVGSSHRELVQILGLATRSRIMAAEQIQSDMVHEEVSSSVCLAELPTSELHRHPSGSLRTGSRAAPIDSHRRQYVAHPRGSRTRVDARSMWRVMKSRSDSSAACRRISFSRVLCCDLTENAPSKAGISRSAAVNGSAEMESDGSSLGENTRTPSPLELERSANQRTPTLLPLSCEASRVLKRMAYGDTHMRRQRDRDKYGRRSPGVGRTGAAASRLHCCECLSSPSPNGPRTIHEAPRHTTQP